MTPSTPPAHRRAPGHRRFRRNTVRLQPSAAAVTAGASPAAARHERPAG
ncbi:hypothetical protein [Arthrobacter sp. 754]